MPIGTKQELANLGNTNCLSKETQRVSSNPLQGTGHARRNMNIDKPYTVMRLCHVCATLFWLLK